MSVTCAGAGLSLFCTSLSYFRWNVRLSRSVLCRNIFGLFADEQELFRMFLLCAVVCFNNHFLCWYIKASTWVTLKRSSMVCWLVCLSVCLSVCHDSEPCRNWTSRHVFGIWTPVHPRNHVRCGSYPHTWMSNFESKREPGQDMSDGRYTRVTHQGAELVWRGCQLGCARWGAH